MEVFKNNKFPNKIISAFTLMEMLVVLSIISIIVTLSFTVFNSYKLNKYSSKLFIKAYNLVGQTTTAMILDPFLYQNAYFDNSFCNNFASSLNIVGASNCTYSSVAPTSNCNPYCPNFITTDGMRWFDMDQGFTSCVSDSGLQGNCIKIEVDVNGIKGLNTNNRANPEQDILTIYVSQSGQVSYPYAYDPNNVSNEKNYIANQ